MMPHHVYDCIHQFIEKRLAQVQQASMPGCPAQYPAEDIAPSFIAGKASVRQGKAQAADMVCYHAVRHPGRFMIRYTGYFRYLLQNGHKKVGVIVTGLSLQYLADALKTGSGIAIVMGQ